MADQWGFWRRRLGGEVLPIHDGEPQSGFYRIKMGENWLPIAYWFRESDGALCCRLGREAVETQKAQEWWPFASKHPVAHAIYQRAVAGAPWPDFNEVANRDRANSIGAADALSFDGLKDRIEDLAREADRLIKTGAAGTQEAADQASDLANRLGELWTAADEERKREKKPHDDAAKAVQQKWLPVLTAAEVYKRVKATVVTPFLVAQEAKRKAAEADARKVAEQAAQSGAPLFAERSPTAKAGSAGRRSVALRTVRRAEIEDRAAVLAFFADSQQVTELLQTLSDRAVRAGVAVPGVKVIENQVAA